MDNETVNSAIATALEANELDNKKNIYIWNDKKRTYDVIDGNTGKLVVALDQAELVFSSAKYSHAAGEIVCEAIRSGMTMKQIKADPRLPEPSAIYAWKRMFPDFAKKMEHALRDRANFFHDEAIDAVSATSLHKDEVPYLKLKVDTLKWAAEKADPERFGTKKGDLHVSTPSVIVLNTGINRKDAPTIEELLNKPATVEAEFTEVKEIKDV